LKEFFILKGVEIFDSILQLQRNLEAKIQSLGSRGNEARKVIDYLFLQPVIDASKIVAITGKSRATNYKLIDELEKLDVLKEITGAQRNKLYIFNDYMELFKNE